jgi:hypothetical protein
MLLFLYFPVTFYLPIEIPITKPSSLIPDPLTRLQGNLQKPRGGKGWRMHLSPEPYAPPSPSPPESDNRKGTRKVEIIPHPKP